MLSLSLTSNLDKSHLIQQTSVSAVPQAEMISTHTGSPQGFHRETPETSPAQWYFPGSQGQGLVKDHRELVVRRQGDRASELSLSAFWVQSQRDLGLWCTNLSLQLWAFSEVLALINIPVPGTSLQLYPINLPANNDSI